MPVPGGTLAFIPSPSRSVWDLGPVPIRAYALCIIAGIVAAIWIGERRWVARGGRRGTVSDIAVWAVVFGLVGGRLYHVITDNELYFREGRDPVRALYIWEGGLGIWGAIALGGVGAWIGCRRRGIKLPPFADAAAPGIAVAQAIGRWGNWFNQELFGRPTDLPWAVEIDPGKPNTVPGATTYHPTFLYESLWNLALAGVLVWVDRRFRMGRGRVFALYVMGYTAGRVWIEMLRIDTANRILGVRLNVWTSIVVFVGALIYFLLHRGPRETEVEPGVTAAPPETPTPAETPASTEPKHPAEAGSSTGSKDPIEVSATEAGSSTGSKDPIEVSATEAGSSTGSKDPIEVSATEARGSSEGTLPTDSPAPAGESTTTDPDRTASEPSGTPTGTPSTAPAAAGPVPSSAADPAASTTSNASPADSTTADSTTADSTTADSAPAGSTPGDDEPTDPTTGRDTPAGRDGDDGAAHEPPPRRSRLAWRR